MTAAETTYKEIVAEEDRDYTQLLLLAEMLDEERIEYELDENKIIFATNKDNYYIVQAYEANTIVIEEEDFFTMEYVSETEKYLYIKEITPLAEYEHEAYSAKEALGIIN